MDFHLRGGFSLAKFERFVKAVKVIVFDVALLILFVVFLFRVVRLELGW